MGTRESSNDAILFLLTKSVGGRLFNASQLKGKQTWIFNISAEYHKDQYITCTRGGGQSTSFLLKLDHFAGKKLMNHWAKEREDDSLAQKSGDGRDLISSPCSYTFTQ